MPQYVFGNMWSVLDETDLFLFTANATIKNNGALVMGRGMARRVRDRFPGIDKKIGEEIRRTCGAQGRYGLLVSNQWRKRYAEDKMSMGAFQVKRHFRDQASVALIEYAADGLKRFVRENPGLRIDLNYPGIGNGGLTPSVVEPLLRSVPDTVHIWRFEHERSTA